MSPHVLEEKIPLIHRYPDRPRSPRPTGLQMGDTLRVRGQADPLASSYLANRLQDAKAGSTPPRPSPAGKWVGGSESGDRADTAESASARRGSGSSAPGPLGQTKSMDLPDGSYDSLDDDDGSGSEWDMDANQRDLGDVPMLLNVPEEERGESAARVFVVDGLVRARSGPRAMVCVTGALLEVEGVPRGALAGPTEASFRGGRARVLRSGLLLTVRFEPPSPKFRHKHGGDMVSYRLVVSEAGDEAGAFLFSLRGMSSVAWRDPSQGVVMWGRLWLHFLSRPAEAEFLRVIAGVTVAPPVSPVSWTAVCLASRAAMEAAPGWVPVPELPAPSAARPGRGAISDWRVAGACVVFGLAGVVAVVEARRAARGERSWVAAVGARLWSLVPGKAQGGRRGL